jgi:hypothetical protein
VQRSLKIEERAISSGGDQNEKLPGGWAGSAPRPMRLTLADESWWVLLDSRRTSLPVGMDTGCFPERVTLVRRNCADRGDQDCSGKSDLPRPLLPNMRSMFQLSPKLEL